MAGMTAYVPFRGRFEQLIAESRVAGVTAGGNVASGFAGALSKFAAPVAVAVAAGAAFKLGESFDKAYDKIRIGTGATGDRLAGLRRDFKAVAASGPADFDTVSTAITSLNQRLGITGKPLQDLSKGVVRLSRLTKTDLGTNIESVTRVFGDWGVAVGDQSGKLDTLFRASQATGTSVDRISSLMVKFGSPLRQLGFTFDQTAALAGKFEKEGVNTELVMGSMRIALGRMAREGEPAKETLARVTDQIKNAGSVSEANALALELFGARAGPDMAAAIREGRFELGSLYDQVSNGTETLEKAGKDTSSWSGKLQTLKNKVLVGLEPIAIRTFNAVGHAMDAITPIAGAVAGAVGEVFSILFDGDFTGVGPFSEDSPIVDGLFRIRELVLGAAGAVQDWLVPVFDRAGQVVDRVATFLRGHAATAFAALGGAVAAVAAPAVLGTLLAGLGWLFGLLGAVASALASPVFLVAALGAAFVVAYRQVEPFRTAVNGVASAIWGGLVAAFNWVKDDGIPAVLGAWHDLVDGFNGDGGDGPFGRAGEALRTVATRVQAVVDAVRSVDWAKTWSNVTSGLADVGGRLGDTAVGEWATDVAGSIRDGVAGIDWGEVWSGITDGIGDGIAWLGDVDWAGLFNDVRDFLQPGIDAVGELADSLTDLVSPLWDLTTALGSALAPVLRLVWPVLRTVGIAVVALGYVFHKLTVFELKALAAVISWVAEKILPALTWVITNVVAPVISGLVSVILWAGTAISKAATWLWGTVLQPVFSAISAYITTFLIPAWRRIFDVASTVFSGVWAAVQFAWGIVQPIFSAIVGFIRDQLEVRFQALAFVAGIVWSAIQTAVSDAWGFIQPKLQAIVDFVTDHVLPVWSRISDAVGSAFSKVPGLIQSALRTAGNIVAGFLRAAAGVANAIGLDSLIGDPLERAADAADRWGEGPTGSTPSEQHSAGGVTRMALGGRVTGGTPGKDSVPIWAMPGEFMQRAAAVRKWGMGAMEDLNRGQVPAGWSVPGFADGGPIGWAKDKLSAGVDALRDVAAGGVGRAWPELGQSGTLFGGDPAGLAAGAANKLRSAVIEWVKGKADTLGAYVGSTALQGLGGGPVVPGSNRALGQAMAAARGWVGAQWTALDHLWTGESGWRNTAQNPTSTAYGIAQFLNSTWAGYGIPKTSDPGRQIEAGFRYIASSYGNPVNALSKWLSRSPHWYAQGGPILGDGALPGLTVHGRTFDTGGVLNPGWNLVKNMTGDKEVLRRDSDGITRPLFGDVHLHDDADIDHLLQGASTRVMMSRL